MIPPKTDPLWKNLLTGKLQHQFKLPSAAMCVARNQRLLMQDSSPQTLEKCVEEVHLFFCKFERVVEDDLRNLIK